MKYNYLDDWYKALLSLLVSEDQSFNKSDRTGTGTKSLFGIQFRHNMSDGFPLLTTKKMHWKSICTELLWFLKGDTNIKYLVDNDCHIWDGDCFANYSKNVWGYSNLELLTKEEFINKIKTDDEFAKKWGELGPIYGAQWRRWTQYEIDMPGFDAHFDETETDQIQNLINELKTNPDSRRLMVNAWNVADLPKMVLPPCHYGFQMYTRELSEKERVDLTMFEEITKEQMDEFGVPKRAISLMWNQRSVDTGLGLGFNIASYGLLLMMIAKQVNMVPDQLIGNLGDVHLYLNHIEPIKEQLNREPYELPTVEISDRFVNDISEYTLEDIVLQNYQSHPSIKMPLSN